MSFGASAAEGDSWADHDRQDVCAVISEAMSLLRLGSPVAAAAYISQNMRLKSFQEILDGFEAPVPEKSTVLLNAHSLLSSAENTIRGRASVGQLAAVLQLLNAPTPNIPNPPLQPFLDQCLALVVDRWGDVAKWMLFFLRAKEWSTYHKGDVSDYIYVLRSITPGRGKNPYKCEIISHPSTMDIFIALLCLEAPDGKPATMREEPGAVCAILDLFVECIAESTAGMISMADRLVVLDGPTRRKLFTGISKRLQDVKTRLKTKANLLSAMADLCNLVSPLCRTILQKRGRVISERKLFLEATPILRSLVDEATRHQYFDENFWAGISEMIKSIAMVALQPSGTRRIRRTVIRGGLVTSSLKALLYIPSFSPPGLDAAAVGFLYLLPDSHLYRDLLAGGMSPAVLSEISAGLPSRNGDSPKYIYDAYAFALSCCARAFEGHVHKSMRLCCSSMHKTPFVPDEEHTGVKTCSKCRSVFYCSEACQKGDWAKFHSLECSQADDNAVKRGVLSGGHRRSKLAFLASVVSLTLPTLPELLAWANIPTSYSARTTAEIPVFVFTGAQRVMGQTDRFGLWAVQTVSSVLSMGVTVFLGGQAGPRILEFAQDVERNPQSLVLVATILESKGVGTLIFSKMKYSPNPRGEERYKVVSSVIGAFLDQECGATPWVIDYGTWGAPLP